MKFVALVAIIACLAYVNAQTPAPGAAFNPSVDCPYYCNLLDSVAVRNVCGNATDMWSNFGYAGGIQGCVAACTAIGSVVIPNQVNLQGFIGNTSGNTMGCRLYHAGAIITDGSAHCPHAAVHGGNVCVGSAQTALPDSCATWCALLGAACNETYINLAGTTFDGLTCGTHCALAHGIPTSFTYPVSTGGDNLACHQYHATAALIYKAAGNETLRVQHCSHASPLGGGVCASATSPRRVFCGEIALTCNGTRNPYSTPAQCLSDAANYSIANIGEAFGAVNSTGGDTLSCRFYHGGIPAIADPTTHCPHTAWASATCGTRPSTAVPTTVAPTTATTGSASSLVLSVFVVLAALLVAFF